VSTALIKRELPHLWGLIIDGFTWTMIPTLTFLSTKIEGWTQIFLQAFVIFLGALSGFRSKTFGDYRAAKRHRDETEMSEQTVTQAEGHLR
jgi:hypothetical protein